MIEHNKAFKCLYGKEVYNQNSEVQIEKKTVIKKVWLELKATDVIKS